MHEGQDVRGPPPCTPLHKHRPGPSTSRAGHDGCSRGPTSSWGSLHTETKREKEPPPATQQPLPLPRQVTQSQPHSPHSPCSCPERKRNRGSRERRTCEQSVHCTPTSLTHPTPLHSPFSDSPSCHWGWPKGHALRSPYERQWVEPGDGPVSTPTTPCPTGAQSGPQLQQILAKW